MVYTQTITLVRRRLILRSAMVSVSYKGRRETICPAPSPQYHPAIAPYRSKLELSYNKYKPCYSLSTWCAPFPAPPSIRKHKGKCEQPPRNIEPVNLLAKCITVTMRIRHYLFGKIPAIFPAPPARLCRTIISAAAAAARRSFCRLLSLRYRSASGRIRRIRRIISSLGSA